MAFEVLLAFWTLSVEFNLDVVHVSPQSGFWTYLTFWPCFLDCVLVSVGHSLSWVVKLACCALGSWNFFVTVPSLSYHLFLISFSPYTLVHCAFVLTATLDQSPTLSESQAAVQRRVDMLSGSLFLPWWEGSFKLDYSEGGFAAFPSCSWGKGIQNSCPFWDSMSPCAKWLLLFTWDPCGEILFLHPGSQVKISLEVKGSYLYWCPGSWGLWVLLKGVEMHWGWAWTGGHPITVSASNQRLTHRAIHCPPK